MFSYYPRTAASTTARSLSRQTGRRNAATTASTPTSQALKGGVSSVPKQSTDSIWESYGFGKKDNGMGAWYFVP
ncbi:hypothetical protein ACA910_008029 [Epithemia clementina (nom. ined.)]